MSHDAEILRELWHPGVTARETCSCGAVFETTAGESRFAGWR